LISAARYTSKSDYATDEHLITDDCNEAKQELGRAGQILAVGGVESFTIPRMAQLPVDKATTGSFAQRRLPIDDKRD
jgi:hypothetical protein